MGRKSFSKRERFQLFKRDGYACQYCGRKAPDVQLELDHIDPIILGGPDDPGNLITACFDCNRGKSTSTVIPPETEQPIRQPVSEDTDTYDEDYIDKWDVLRDEISIDYYQRLDGETLQNMLNDAELFRLGMRSVWRYANTRTIHDRCFALCLSLVATFLSEKDPTDVDLIHDTRLQGVFVFLSSQIMGELEVEFQRQLDLIKSEQGATA